MSFGHLELQNLSNGGLGLGLGDIFVTDTPTDRWTDRRKLYYPSGGLKTAVVAVKAQASSVDP